MRSGALQLLGGDAVSFGFDLDAIGSALARCEPPSHPTSLGEVWTGTTSPAVTPAIDTALDSLAALIQILCRNGGGYMTPEDQCALADAKQCLRAHGRSTEPAVRTRSTR